MSPRTRRSRGARESLASIVLGLESLVVFLAGLALHGLDAIAPLPSWWGIIAGVVFALVLLATIGVLRHRWGIALGWVWQAVIALGGILVPALLFVALIFGGMYAYATIKGGALDARNAQLAAGTDDTNGDTP